MVTNDNLLGSGDQETQLDEALKVVKKESFEMKRCLDKDRIIDALRHATNMLGELKTNSLSPKFYYQLFIDATKELQHLETFLTDLAERGNCPLELYEQVQYAGSIIPRLYLMITIGVVHMKANMVSRSEILHDLVEMCRGEQHPLRGLFLRNYLLQTTKNLLPEKLPSTAKDQDGSVLDAINFIQSNFGEMNKLWVRMQHQGPSREREKRERERMELRILVGTNMVRLSQLEYLDLALYRERVLPGILEQVVSCHDAISQEYLMECVIQVFADEFHLATLREFLEACGELHDGVNMKNVLSCVMERVQALASTGGTELFSLFADTAQKLILERQMPPEDVVSLHYSLSSLAFKCYPDRVDYASTVFDSLLNTIQQKDITEQSQFKPVGRELMKVLQSAIDAYGDAAKVARLQAFQPLMGALDFRSRCRVAASLLQTMVDREMPISTQDELESMEALAAPIINDDKGILNADDFDGEDFQEEQNLLAKTIQLIASHDDHPDTQFLLLSETRKKLGRGGPARVPRTLPSLLFALFQLAEQYKERQTDIENWDAKMRKLFLFAMSSVNALLELETRPEMPFRLYIEAASVADGVPFEERPSVVYEFLSKALSVVEDGIVDSRSKLSCLALLCAAVENTKCLPLHDSNSLANQIALVSSKLFKKADQVRALCNCAPLFWSTVVADKEGPLRDGEKVHQVLVKALKIAAQCMEPLVQVQLLVQLINILHSYYALGCEEITEDALAEVVGRARDCAAQLERSGEADAVERHLAASLASIGEERARDGKLTERLRL